MHKERTSGRNPNLRTIKVYWRHEVSSTGLRCHVWEEAGPELWQDTLWGSPHERAWEPSEDLARRPSEAAGRIAAGEWFARLYIYRNSTLTRWNWGRRRGSCNTQGTQMVMGNGTEDGKNRDFIVEEKKIHLFSMKYCIKNYLYHMAFSLNFLYWPFFFFKPGPKH